MVKLHGQCLGVRVVVKLVEVQLKWSSVFELCIIDRVEDEVMFSVGLTTPKHHRHRMINQHVNGIA